MKYSKLGSRTRYSKRSTGWTVLKSSSKPMWIQFNSNKKQTNLRGIKQSIKQPNYQFKQTRTKVRNRNGNKNKDKEGEQSQLLLKPTEVELGLQVGVEFDNKSDINWA